MAAPRIKAPKTPLAIAPTLPLVDLAPARAQAFKPQRALDSPSGLTITLGRSGGRSLVRKSASHADQNPRVIGNAEKQRLLSAYGIPFPRVRGEGLDEQGRAFFDMDYVPASSLARLLASGEGFEAGAVLTALDRMFWVFRANLGPAIPSDAFSKEIARVASICAERDATGGCAAEIASAARALSALSFEGIPISPAHGNLSLDNILVGQSGNVVFIGCAEAFVNAYYLDLAMLLGDVIAPSGFSTPPLEDEAGNGRIADESGLRAFGAQLHALAAAADPRLPERLPALTALALYRTLAHVDNEARARTVLARLQDLLARAQ